MIQQQGTECREQRNAPPISPRMVSPSARGRSVATTPRSPRHFFNHSGRIHSGRRGFGCVYTVLTTPEGVWRGSRVRGTLSLRMRTEIETTRRHGGLCGSRGRSFLQGPGPVAEATELKRELIQLMKTQNFVLEWFRHQARLKADRARLLFVQPALRAREVFDEGKDSATASERSFNTADQALILT